MLRNDSLKKTIDGDQATKHWTITTALLLTVIGMAKADVTSAVVNLGAPQYNGSVVDGFTAYRLDVTNLTGGDVTAIDAFNNGGDFFGPMYQVWFDNRGLNESPSLEPVAYLTILST